ncbi:MAG TPA: hypothetical protein VK665_12120 [Candidatus Elarobacter sp.]|nr:hypothetical protein [Candidatus Elarobacter sp.]
MEDVDVNCYAHPDRQRPLSSENLRKRPPTYSVVWGYGFRPSLNPQRESESLVHRLAGIGRRLFTMLMLVKRI